MAWIRRWRTYPRCVGLVSEVPDGAGLELRFNIKPVELDNYRTVHT